MRKTEGGFERSRSRHRFVHTLHKTFSLLKKEIWMDEFRAGIHNDRGFGNNFRSEQGL